MVPGVLEKLPCSGHTPVPAHIDVFLNPKLPKSHCSRVLWKFHCIVQSPMALLPEGRAEISNPPIICCFFLVTSPYPEAILGHLININSDMIERNLWWITKGTPHAQEIPRVLGTLCQEMGDQMYFYYTMPVTLPEIFNAFTNKYIFFHATLKTSIH